MKRAAFAAILSALALAPAFAPTVRRQPGGKAALSMTALPPTGDNPP